MKVLIMISLRSLTRDHMTSYKPKEVAGGLLLQQVVLMLWSPKLSTAVLYLKHKLYEKVMTKIVFLATSKTAVNFVKKSNPSVHCTLEQTYCKFFTPPMRNWMNIYDSLHINVLLCILKRHITDPLPTSQTWITNLSQ